MEKNKLLEELKTISDSFFQKKDYINSGIINRAMDVINSFEGELPHPNRGILLTEYCKHKGSNNCDCEGIYCDRLKR